MSEQVAVIEATRVPALVDDAPLTPLAMLDRALSSGASVDVLTKLMDLSERWEKNQARKAFDEAMAAAKAEIPTIAKNRSVGFESKGSKVGYRHEDLAEIARTVDPVLSRHGLSYRFRTTSAPNEPVTVTCIVSHRLGYSEENTLSAGRDDSGAKNSIQAVGSTLTYLQRYTLKAALGLAASNDDDGKSADVGEAISQKQVETLQQLIVQTSSNINLFCKAMGVEAVPDLPAKEFERAHTMLQAKLRKQQEGAAS